MATPNNLQILNSKFVSLDTKHQILETNTKKYSNEVSLLNNEISNLKLEISNLKSTIQHIVSNPPIDKKIQERISDIENALFIEFEKIDLGENNNDEKK
jgi:hypothetical protein